MPTRVTAILMTALLLCGLGIWLFGIRKPSPRVLKMPIEDVTSTVEQWAKRATGSRPAPIIISFSTRADSGILMLSAVPSTQAAISAFAETGNQFFKPRLSVSVNGEAQPAPSPELPIVSTEQLLNFADENHLWRYADGMRTVIRWRSGRVIGDLNAPSDDAERLARQVQKVLSDPDAVGNAGWAMKSRLVTQLTQVLVAHEPVSRLLPSWSPGSY